MKNSSRSYITIIHNYNFGTNGYNNHDNVGKDKQRTAQQQIVY